LNSKIEDNLSKMKSNYLKRSGIDSIDVHSLNQMTNKLNKSLLVAEIQLASRKNNNKKKDEIDLYLTFDEIKDILKSI
jgi:hypothetical protein